VRVCFHLHGTREGRGGGGQRTLTNFRRGLRMKSNIHTVRT
jgi:hypothetical protein